MQTHSFKFTGKGGEYFQIWIVNLLLSIITFGIYSAWAKVRRNQYLYRNTQVAGASFDYHATPGAILKGRLIAIVFFVALNIVQRTNPMAYLVAMLLFVLALPWVVRQALRFKLRNSSYRGLRFKFVGSLGGAYKTVLLWPALSLFSAYLLSPFAYQRFKAYEHNNSLFGQTQFSFSTKARQFYLVYLVALLGLIIAVVLGWHAFLYLQGLGSIGSLDVNVSSFIHMVIIVYGALILWGIIVHPFIASRIYNLTWNGTQLGDVKFHSNLRARHLFLINLTNLIAVIFTLGLFQPFAKIRLIKYQLSCLSIDAPEQLAEFIANQAREPVGGFGEGMVDVFDVDLTF